MGFSMGGWYTLNLAATSAPDTYSAALAINRRWISPPV